MNETIQTLISRRSIRSYKPDQISDEALQQIIAAGEFAPSGKSLQPVTIAVTQNPAVIARLSAMNAKIMGVTSDPFYGAPTLCIIFADMQKSANAWSDACLVLGNMMNAAASLGIGSCWIGFTLMHFTDTSRNTAFGVPHTHKPMFAVAFGRPAKEKGTAPRRREATVNYL